MCCSIATLFFPVWRKRKRLICNHFIFCTSLPTWIRLVVAAVVDSFLPVLLESVPQISKSPTSSCFLVPVPPYFITRRSAIQGGAVHINTNKAQGLSDLTSLTGGVLEKVTAAVTYDSIVGLWSLNQAESNILFCHRCQDWKTDNRWEKRNVKVTFDIFVLLCPLVQVVGRFRSLSLHTARHCVDLVELCFVARIFSYLNELNHNFCFCTYYQNKPWGDVFHWGFKKIIKIKINK